MNDQEIKAIVFQELRKIAPEIDSESLGMDDNIREVYGIDSFDFLQFIIRLDAKFGINTPEEDYGEMTTLKTLIAYINLHKQ